jgi:predicted permease
MTVNGQIFRIIGVAPAGFQGTTLGNKPDLFVPITMRGALEGYKGYENRRQYWVYVFARLGAGVTLAQAQARENVLYHRIINEVELPLQKGVSEKTLARFKTKQLELVDGRRGSSDLHEQTETPMLLLFGTTLFVLVIACANIANLLLARAANRATEIAVRLSLGATRRQLLGQLLTESVLLAVLGGLAGLVVAWATLRGLVLLLPADVSDALSFTLDGRAIVFAGVLSMVTGLLFGLFPALHSTSPDLVTALRSGSGKTSATRGATRFRTSLVTAQIALSMALIASAGLFLESLANVSRVNLGVDIDRLIMFGVSPALNGYSGARTQEIYSSIDRELTAIPGVRGVAAARVAVLAGNNWDNDVNVQGFPRTPDTDADAYFNAVSPAFFHTMGIPLVSGREFTAGDVLGTPGVAIVNESFVKKFRLGSSAVGKMIGVNVPSGDSLTHLIVGVVKDSHYSDVKQELRPVYYLPYKQDTSSMGDMFFYVRGAVDPNVLMPPIRAAVAKVDRTLPVVHLKTMPQQIKDNVYLDRMITSLTAAFAALATLLAAIGLYGVLAYSVVQRTKEIGVRIALGADPRTIVTMVLRHVGAMTLGGAVVGVLGALGIGRAAQSLLFGVQGRDPLVMLMAIVAMAAVALAAGSIPAWRAARVDPVKALKYE